MREYRAEGTSVHVHGSSNYHSQEEDGLYPRLGAAGTYSTPEDAQQAAQDMQAAYDEGVRETRASLINSLDRGSFSGGPRDEDDDY